MGKIGKWILMYRKASNFSSQFWLKVPRFFENDENLENYENPAPENRCLTKQKNGLLTTIPQVPYTWCHVLWCNLSMTVFVCWVFLIMYTIIMFYFFASVTGSAQGREGKGGGGRTGGLVIEYGGGVPWFYWVLLLVIYCTKGISSTRVVLVCQNSLDTPVFRISCHVMLTPAVHWLWQHLARTSAGTRR